MPGPVRAVAAVFLMVGVPALAQTLSVYSEFSRIDPFGQVVRADRGADPPREILSPALPRGATSSFHMVVEGRPGDTYTFQVAQNPENATRVTAYRETYLQVGGEWVPDRLQLVQLPYDGRLASADIPMQTAQAFWVDLRVDRNAPVERVKVEPQVYMDGGWIRYPMEARVTAAALGGVASALPAVGGAGSPDEPSTYSALKVWAAVQCNPTEKNKDAQTLSIRNLIARNAGQDVRFAGGSAPPQLLRSLGLSDRAAFCRAQKLKLAAPEDYLRIRDAVIGAREP